MFEEDDEVDLSNLDFDDLFGESVGTTEIVELSEFDISKILRGIRKRKNEVARLADYKKKLLEQIGNTVGLKISKLEDEMEARRQAIKTWLDKREQKSISFPDIGILMITDKKEFTYDEEQIIKFLKANNKTEFIKSVESLDKAAFKKMVEDTKLKVTGYTVGTKTTTTFKEA